MRLSEKKSENKRERYEFEGNEVTKFGKLSYWIGVHPSCPIIVDSAKLLDCLD